jgi:hypothetical protein
MIVDIVENIESVLPLFQVMNFGIIPIPNSENIKTSSFDVLCTAHSTDLTLKLKDLREGGVRGGPGESPFHREFKEYVSRHPQILGLPNYVGFGELEQVLPSGDIADVSFTHKKEWIIAEVKSKLSSTADIYRGLYQCVKYQAVARALQSENGLKPSCRVVLVLESEFPDGLIELKNVLGVEVVSMVSMQIENAYR